MTGQSREGSFADVCVDDALAAPQSPRFRPDHWWSKACFAWAWTWEPPPRTRRNPAPVRTRATIANEPCPEDRRCFPVPGAQRGTFLALATCFGSFLVFHHCADLAALCAAESRRACDHRGALSLGSSRSATLVRRVDGRVFAPDLGAFGPKDGGGNDLGVPHHRSRRGATALGAGAAPERTPERTVRACVRGSIARSAPSVGSAHVGAPSFGRLAASDACARWW